MAEKGKKKSKCKNTQSSIDEEAGCKTKKPPMKTASDVISRLLWDESLPQEKFTVGYIDRFDGIVEKPFTALDWSDPAVVDNFSLALPKHRIQYFKYKNKKVWDKTNRKDIIFGSTGFSLNIYEFMALVDQEELDFWEEGLVIPINDDASSEDYDIDNEEEYDISDRSNFFIAARIQSKDTVSNLKKVSDYMKSREELLSDCCNLPEMFHLTLCVLKLDSPSDIIDAISSMKRLASQNLPSVTLKLEGLDNFRQRVLFARVEKNENLFNLRKHLVDELINSSINITDKYSFVPHVTISKLSRPVCRLRRNNYIDQYLYLKFEDDEFGTETITDLYLCEMGAARQDDGFYKCAAVVSLNQSVDEL